MFDYDLEVAEVEREFFSIPAKMEITFNYIDETFTLVARHLDHLSRYYDKKSCLNQNHSEKIIDIFRFGITKDAILSKSLDKSFKGFDNSRSNQMYTAQTGSIAAIAPQSSLMEVDCTTNHH